MAELKIIIQRHKTVIEKLNTIFGWKKDIVDTMEKDTKVDVKYESDLKWIKMELEKTLPDYIYLPIDIPEEVPEDEVGVEITLKGLPGFIVVIDDDKEWVIEDNGNASINVGPKLEDSTFKVSYRSKYGILINEAIVTVVGGLNWKPLIDWHAPLPEYATNNGSFTPVWLNMVLNNRFLRMMMKRELYPQLEAPYSHWYLVIHPVMKTGESTYDLDRSSLLYFDRLNAFKVLFDFKDEIPSDVVIPENPPTTMFEHGYSVNSLFGDIAFKKGYQSSLDLFRGANNPSLQEESFYDNGNGWYANMLVQSTPSNLSCTESRMEFTAPAFHYRIVKKDIPTLPIVNLEKFLHLPGNTGVEAAEHLIGLVIYKGDENVAPITKVDENDPEITPYITSTEPVRRASNGDISYRYVNPLALYGYDRGTVKLTEENSTQPVIIDINNTNKEWCHWLDEDFLLEIIQYRDKNNKRRYGITTVDSKKSDMIKYLHSPYVRIIVSDYRTGSGEGGDGEAVDNNHLLNKLIKLEDGRFVLDLMDHDEYFNSPNNTVDQRGTFLNVNPNIKKIIYDNPSDDLAQVLDGKWHSMYVSIFVMNVYFDNSTTLKYSFVTNKDDPSKIEAYENGVIAKKIQSTTNMNQWLTTGNDKWQKNIHPEYINARSNQIFGLIYNKYSYESIARYPMVDSGLLTRGMDDIRFGTFRSFYDLSGDSGNGDIYDASYGLNYNSATGEAALGFILHLTPTGFRSFPDDIEKLPKQKY